MKRKDEIAAKIDLLERIRCWLEKDWGLSPSETEAILTESLRIKSAPDVELKVTETSVDISELNQLRRIDRAARGVYDAVGDNTPAFQRLAKALFDGTATDE